MPRRSTAAAALLPLLLLGGCLAMPRRTEGHYRVVLEEVQRSPEAARRGGEAGPVAAAAGSEWRYDDGLIAFQTHFEAASLRFRLLNKAATPMTLVWDEAEFIGELGESHPVINSHQGFRTREHNPPPDVVAPGAWHRERATPVVRVAGPRGEVWQAVQLLSMEYDPAGRRIGLVLPLEVDGEEYLYTFWYRIRAVYPDN